MGNACCDNRASYQPNSIVEIEHRVGSGMPDKDGDRVRGYSSLRTEANAVPSMSNRVQQSIRKLSKFDPEPKKIWRLKHPYNLVYANQETSLQNQLPRGYIKLYKTKENGEFTGYYEGKITDSFEPDLNEGFFVYHNGSHLIGTGPQAGIYTNEATSLHYEGGWVNEQPHGRGIEQSNKGLYEGDYFEGEKQGIGRFNWSDGATYEGTFDRGTFHGKGCFKNAAHNYQYEGDYCQDYSHGQGVEECERENYKGEFHKGKRCGQGRLQVFEDDSKKQIKYVYEGTFQDGRPHGQGHFEESPRDNKLEGIWNEGVLVAIQ